MSVLQVQSSTHEKDQKTKSIFKGRKALPSHSYILRDYETNLILVSSCDAIYEYDHTKESNKLG